MKALLSDPGALLWVAATRWRVAADRALEPLGITNAQYVVLSALYGIRGGDRRPNQRRVAEEAGLDPLFVSKLVTALDRQGLVDRTRDPADSRSFQLTLTERGVEVTRAARATIRSLHESTFAAIGGVLGPAVAELTDTLSALLATSLGPRPPGRDGGQADAAAGSPS